MNQYPACVWNCQGSLVCGQRKVLGFEETNIIIERFGGNTNAIVLYDKHGNTLNLNDEGFYDFSWILRNAWDNRIIQVDVPLGIKVTFWQHPGKVGATSSVEGPVRNWRLPHGLYEDVSEIEVKRSTDGLLYTSC